MNGAGDVGAVPIDRGEVRYTKAIDLSVSADGSLVDASGRAVLGFSRGAEGEKQCPSALRAPIACTPRQMTHISQVVNLDPNAMMDPYFDQWQPWFTAATSSALLIYDSVGTSHWGNFYFNKTGEFSISYQVTVDGGDLISGAPGIEQVLGGGTLTFDTDGALLDAQTPDIILDTPPARPSTYGLGRTVRQRRVCVRRKFCHRERSVGAFPKRA